MKTLRFIPRPQPRRHGVGTFGETNTMNHVNNAMSAHSMTINLGAQNNSEARRASVFERYARRIES